MRIAALFVVTGGVYFGLPDVDPWDVTRDARAYAGSDPVVAHPPCERWGRYWHGGPSARERRVKGDDGGCFASALANVRRVGGVLEHPEASAAWKAHGLNTPPREGGWIAADLVGGFTCCVEQGHYGHRARKATWLYAVAPALPSLTWGPSLRDHRVDGCGFHTTAERIERLGGKTRKEWLAERGIRSERLTKREILATPIAFRDVLLSIARSVRAVAA